MCVCVCEEKKIGRPFVDRFTVSLASVASSSRLIELGIKPNVTPKEYIRTEPYDDRLRDRQCLRVM